MLVRFLSSATRVDEDVSMIEAILRGIGVLYGLSAVLSLAIFGMYASYGPSLAELEPRQGLYHLLFFAMPMMNAVVGLALLYAFWRLRRWGCWLAIAWNSLYLLILMQGFAAAGMRGFSAIAPGAVVFAISAAGLLVGITIVCSLARARRIMR